VAKTYSKLPYASEVPQVRPKGKAPDAITFVIDPGHGGEDNGAVGPTGIKEKDVNLALALKVAALLRERGFHVEMTRWDDSFPELYNRPKLAHCSGADAYVSIHHNAPAAGKNPKSVRYHAVYAWNDLGEGLASAISKRMTIALLNLVDGQGVLRANFAVTRNPEIPSCLVEADFISHPQGEKDCANADRQLLVARAIVSGLVDWAEGR